MEKKEIFRDNFYRLILDTIPSPVLIVDEDVRIMDYNNAAYETILREKELIIKNLFGEVFHCLNVANSDAGCGKTPACKDCMLRNSVKSSIKGDGVNRQKVKMSFVRDNKTRQMHMLITTKPFQYNGMNLILVIFENIADILALGGVLPICANCKKIRDDQQYWQNIENYFNTELNIYFTHSICPPCSRELYPEIYSDEA
jgi:hypothetical protein